MGKLLVLVLLALAGYWAFTQYGGGTRGLRIEGRDVHLSTDDLDVQFSEQLDYDDALMIFGGDNSQPRNSITHVTIAALPIEQARLIHRDHPDFHRCSSPGARQAQRSIETFSLLGSSSRARRALVKAVDRHEEQLRSGGDRTCLRVHGARLQVASARVRETGQELGPKLARSLRHTQLLLASDASIVDCESALR